MERPSRRACVQGRRKLAGSKNMEVSPGMPASPPSPWQGQVIYRGEKLQLPEITPETTKPRYRPNRPICPLGAWKRDVPISGQKDTVSSGMDFSTWHKICSRIKAIRDGLRQTKDKRINHQQSSIIQMIQEVHETEGKYQMEINMYHKECVKSSFVNISYLNQIVFSF